MRRLYWSIIPTLFICLGTSSQTLTDFELKEAKVQQQNSSCYNVVLREIDDDLFARIALDSIVAMGGKTILFFKFNESMGRRIVMYCAEYDLNTKCFKKRKRIKCRKSGVINYLILQQRVKLNKIDILLIDKNGVLHPGLLSVEFGPS